MEKVLGVEKAPRRVGLHAQEPVQARGRVPTFSSCTSLWYDRCLPCITRRPSIQSISALSPATKIFNVANDFLHLQLHFSKSTLLRPLVSVPLYLT